MEKYLANPCNFQLIGIPFFFLFFFFLITGWERWTDEAIRYTFFYLFLNFFNFVEEIGRKRLSFG